MSYVPFGPALWASWWQHVVSTVAGATSIGFVVFIAMTVVGCFRIALRYWKV